MISILFLTLDRYELTKESIQTAIINMGDVPLFEILVCDNASRDQRIVDWVTQQKLFYGETLTYHRKNSKNEGIGKSLNQLYLRSRGEYICLMGNDVEMPKNWLTGMLRYVDIPNVGIIGMDWNHPGLPPLSNQNGHLAHWVTPKQNRVFGPMLIKRSVIDRVGLFPEHYDIYGMEDSSLNERVNRAGFKSLYVPNTLFRCHHTGTGRHDLGEYRKMKNDSLIKNLKLFEEDVKAWDEGKLPYEPLPPMRDPI